MSRSRQAYTAAQAYLEYTSESLPATVELSLHREGLLETDELAARVSPIRTLINRCVMFPEYMQAKGTLKRERALRELGSLSLAEVATITKQEHEKRLYDKLPLWAHTPKGTLAGLERTTRSRSYPEKMSEAIKSIQQWGDESGYTDEARWLVHFGYVPEEFRIKSGESTS